MAQRTPSVTAFGHVPWRNISAKTWQKLSETSTKWRGDATANPQLKSRWIVLTIWPGEPALIAKIKTAGMRALIYIIRANCLAWVPIPFHHFELEELMTSFMRQILFTGLTCFFIVVGCAPPGVTLLAGGFHSYQTASEARSRLNEAGVASQWQEEHKRLPHSDARQAYEFLLMSGPFRIDGIGGNLRLTFYNNRLMSTEFSTTQGRELISAMRNQGTTIPSTARQQVVLDRRTRFRYDIDSDGGFRFSWTDIKLEAEWSKWVERNS
jgi:hypothetical protein